MSGISGLKKRDLREFSSPFPLVRINLEDVCLQPRKWALTRTQPHWQSDLGLSVPRTVRNILLLIRYPENGTFVTTVCMRTRLYVNVRSFWLGVISRLHGDEDLGYRYTLKYSNKPHGENHAIMSRSSLPSFPS